MTRILIVDDKQDSLYLLRALLTGHGCEVDEPATGPRHSSKPANPRRTSSSPTSSCP